MFWRRVGVVRPVDAGQAQLQVAGRIAGRVERHVQPRWPPGSPSCRSCRRTRTPTANSWLRSGMVITPPFGSLMARFQVLASGCGTRRREVHLELLGGAQTVVDGHAAAEMRAGGGGGLARVQVQHDVGLGGLLGPAGFEADAHRGQAGHVGGGVHQFAVVADLPAHQVEAVRVAQVAVLILREGAGAGIHRFLTAAARSGYPEPRRSRSRRSRRRSRRRSAAACPAG